MIPTYDPPTYVPDGSTTVFAIPWPYQSTDHIKPYIDGDLVTSGFTVSAPNTTGTLTFTVAPTGNELIIRRQLPRDQQTDFQNQQTFRGKRHEDTYDRTVMQIADNGERIDRLYAMLYEFALVSYYSLPNDHTTVTLNLDSWQSIGHINSLTNALDLITSNEVAGHIYGLRIIDNGTARALTFPAAWRWLVPKPTTTTANKYMVITLECVYTDTFEKRILADWRVEL